MDRSASNSGSGEQLVKPPQQDRSRRTLNRIVRAALDLVAEGGVEAASVHEIARRARASVGSFYARFEGKEDLLRYLEVQLWADARERWEAALEDADWDALGLDDLIATLVRILSGVHRAGSRQRRLLEARRGPGSVSESARSFDEALRRDIRALLLRHAERIDHADPERAVDVALAAVVATLRFRDSDGPAAEALADLDEDEWVAELTRLCRAYLQGSSGGTSDGSGMDFFEIWG